MSTCPICCDTMNSATQKVCKTKCGHEFHRDCLYEWLSKHPSCPLCRQAEDIEFQIQEIGNNSNKEYKQMKHFGETTKMITFLGMSFRKPQKQLLDQCPQGWIHIQERRKSSLAPVYRLKSNDGEEIFIDYYLRQIIMFDELDISKIEEKEGYKTKYYTSEQDIRGYGVYNEKFVYERLVEWMYELMQRSIDEGYEIDYHASMNTLIHDLLTITIQKKGVQSKRNFQTVAIAVIYSVVELMNKIELSKDYLVYMTAGASTIEKMDEVIEYHKQILVHTKCLV